MPPLITIPPLQQPKTNGTSPGNPTIGSTALRTTTHGTTHGISLHGVTTPRAGIGITTSRPQMHTTGTTLTINSVRKNSCRYPLAKRPIPTRNPTPTRMIMNLVSCRDLPSGNGFTRRPSCALPLSVYQQEKTYATTALRQAPLLCARLRHPPQLKAAAPLIHIRHVDRVAGLALVLVLLTAPPVLETLIPLKNHAHRGLVIMLRSERAPISGMTFYT